MRQDIRQPAGGLREYEHRFVRLTSTGAMVAETIDGDKRDRVGAVASGPMVPI
jgi:hypothetical protein